MGYISYSVGCVPCMLVCVISSSPSPVYKTLNKHPLYRTGLLKTGLGGETSFVYHITLMCHDLFLSIKKPDSAIAYVIPVVIIIRVTKKQIYKRLLEKHFMNLFTR